MATKEKIVYYKDERNDDFAGNHIKRKPLGKTFRYIRTSVFFRVFSWILYYVIACPLVYLIQKGYSHQSFVNKKVLKQAKDTGYFMYSNHTQVLNDAYIGPMAAFPRRCFVITGPDAISIKGTRTIVQALGAIPLGGNLKETRQMLSCVETRIAQKAAVMIYPEAHIWPYYTKIRDFPSASFEFAVRLNKPIFVLTNCYQKRRCSRKPKILTFVDGPFYPDLRQGKKAAAEQLRKIAYDTMCDRARTHSTYEYIKYIKEE